MFLFDNEKEKDVAMVVTQKKNVRLNLVIKEQIIFMREFS
jgi:hypothetical protein